MLKKIISLILACLMLSATLIGCKKNDETHEDEQTEPVLDTVFISASEITDYAVIRAENADSGTISAASRLYIELKKTFGDKMQFNTDYAKKVEDIPTDTKEILVGLTNRAESTGVRYLDYEIGFKNGRIIINGGSASAVSEAVDHFISSCVSADGVTVPMAYSIEKAYPMDMLTVDGQLLKNFSVREIDGELDDTLRAYLGEQVGIYSRSLTGNEIILVNDSKYGVTDFDIYMENGNLIIASPEHAGYSSLALDYFIDQVKGAQNGQVKTAGRVSIALEGYGSASSTDISSLRASTDIRINEIKSNANRAVSGTVYYVSSSEGNDSNSGTSPNAPLRTLSKANSKMSAGQTVCLKRGDTWRGEGLTAKANVTITAYGDGPKPVVMASRENGGGAANASKWTDMGGNIWRYEGSNSWNDVGNIVFNDGESYATKIVQLYVKQEGWSNYQLTDFTNAPAQTYVFNSYEDLRNDLDFFHDKPFDGGSGTTKYLYMYSSKGNPALRFNSIEFAEDIKLVDTDVDGVTVDNICFKYTGGHAVAGSAHNILKRQIKNLLVENCEFYWIGGSVHNRIENSVIGTDDTVYDTRYGNAIEIYGGCDGFIARNNYIYQVFDAGITIQLTMGSGSTQYNQKNIEFSDNVIEYCNYSIEYFLTKIPSSNSSQITNFVIKDNLMWNAGYGFCETRMIWGRGFAAHIKSQFTSPCNRAEGFEIKDNIMVYAKDSFLQIRNSFGQEHMPLFEGNKLYGYYDFAGDAAKGYRLGEVRVKSEDTQEWESFDTNIHSYLAKNMGEKYGESNEYFFIN